MRLTLTSIAVVVLISYMVVTFVFTPQTIAIVGTIEQETFDPACREIKPPCALPSLSAPVLVTSDAIYILTSNYSDIMHQIYMFQGKLVTVRGNIRPFNASSVYASYKCSPYPCTDIMNQLVVVSLQLVATTCSTRLFRFGPDAVNL